MRSPSRGNLGGPRWRRMLANHVSVCCQEEHRGGVVGSLDELELWKIAASATGGNTEVTLTLPNLFRELKTPPSPISFTYEHHDMDQAKDLVCLTTLLFALVAGPNRVRLHPSTVRDAERVREAAGIARAHAILKTTDGQRPWLDAVDPLNVAAATPGAADPEPVAAAAALTLTQQIENECGDGRWKSGLINRPSVEDAGSQGILVPKLVSKLISQIGAWFQVGSLFGSPNGNLGSQIGSQFGN